MTMVMKDCLELKTNESSKTKTCFRLLMLTNTPYAVEAQQEAWNLAIYSTVYNQIRVIHN
jgi:hypothetical protein